MSSRHHATVAFVSVTDLIRDSRLDSAAGVDHNDLKLHMLENEQFVISTRDATNKSQQLIPFPLYRGVKVIIFISFA